MAKETKFELTDSIIARDLRDKINYGFSSTVLICLSMIFFCGIVAAIMLFNVFTDLPDSIAFNFDFLGWLLTCLVSFVIIAFIAFVAIHLIECVSHMKKWKNGDFSVVSDLLVSLNKYHYRHGRTAYSAVFEKYGSCTVNAGDSSDPFVGSYSGDEFYLVVFETNLILVKRTRPMLAYNKKRYDYKGK